MTGEVGTVYLLCLSRPFWHARHYSGWAAPGGLARRLSQHYQGKSGENFIEAVVKAGISLDLAVTWDGTRTDERRLKGHGAVRHCPRCTETPREARWMKNRKEYLIWKGRCS